MLKDIIINDLQDVNAQMMALALQDCDEDILKHYKTLMELSIFKLHMVLKMLNYTGKFNPDTLWAFLAELKANKKLGDLDRWILNTMLVIPALSGLLSKFVNLSLTDQSILIDQLNLINGTNYKLVPTDHKSMIRAIKDNGHDYSFIELILDLYTDELMRVDSTISKDANRPVVSIGNIYV
jgi:hypothetical protein